MSASSAKIREPGKTVVPAKTHRTRENRVVGPGEGDGKALQLARTNRTGILSAGVDGQFFRNNVPTTAKKVQRIFVFSRTFIPDLDSCNLPL